MTAGLRRSYADDMLFSGKVIFAVLIYERLFSVVKPNCAATFP